MLQRDEVDLFFIAGDLAVDDVRRTRQATRQPIIVGDDDDGLALRHQLFEQLETLIGRFW